MVKELISVKFITVSPESVVLVIVIVSAGNVDVLFCVVVLVLKLKLFDENDVEDEIVGGISEFCPELYETSSILTFMHILPHDVKVVCFVSI